MPIDFEKPTPITVVEIVHEKLSDADVFGFEAEFSPPEAECAGACEEDALDESAARVSIIDRLREP